MTIHRLTPASTARDFSSLHNKIEVYQRALRDWGGHLTGNEIAVVQILIDRTVGWGRREAYFTIRAMLKGDDVYSGLKMSERTMFRVLASLEAKGLIRRRKDRNVPDRVHFTVNLEWKPAPATAPNRHRLDCQDGTDPCHIGSPPCQDGSLTTGINKQVSTTVSLPGATAPVSLAADEEDRESKRRTFGTDRARLTMTPDAPQAGVDAVEAAFRLALVESFPGTAYRTWGVREKGQIKTVLKNWRGDCTLPEFVDWAVRNWTAIIKKHFNWMTEKKPPEAPSLGFFIAFIDRFADARAEGVLTAWQKADERTQTEKLIAQGMTWEQATAQIAKEKAATGLRSEMEKREVHVRARDYAATRKLAEAKRLAALEGRVPIHPQSQLAKQMRAATALPIPVSMVEVGSGSARDCFEMIDMSQNPFDT